MIRIHLLHAVVAVFAAWCLYNLRTDLVLSATALARWWDVVTLAALLCMLSYVARIARWRTSLARLGHRVALRFAASRSCPGTWVTQSRSLTALPHAHRSAASDTVLVILTCRLVTGGSPC